MSRSPLEKERSVVIKELEGKDEENEEDSDKEYEEEELEEQIFAYSEVDTEKLAEKDEVYGRWNYNSGTVKDIRSNKKKNQDYKLWSLNYLNLEEDTPISDLFDYYYENEIQTHEEYKIGSLDNVQQSKLKLLLNEYKDIYAQSLNELDLLAAHGRLLWY
ncbi:hypothetical protein F8M41_000133 [Gigaspora margarita]|uniref:Uncharacterized protein n=1 Tax=Gigaspora margarita TaxID=4874 RepID=A0A8H4AZJ6_GIGMA|nr:hypothetical protein F8M41_000133 [Gigaspora margarita]